jgi:hypothetical protein
MVDEKKSVEEPEEALEKQATPPGMQPGETPPPEESPAEPPTEYPSSIEKSPSKDPSLGEEAALAKEPTPPIMPEMEKEAQPGEPASPVAPGAEETQPTEGPYTPITSETEGAAQTPSPMTTVAVRSPPSATSEAEDDTSPEEPVSLEIAHVDFDLLDTEGRWLLKVLSGPNTGAEFAMHGGSSYLIGTDTQACKVAMALLWMGKKSIRSLFLVTFSSLWEPPPSCSLIVKPKEQR